MQAQGRSKSYLQIISQGLINSQNKIIKKTKNAASNMRLKLRRSDLQMINCLIV